MEIVEDIVRHGAPVDWLILAGLLSVGAALLQCAARELDYQLKKLGL